MIPSAAPVLRKLRRIFKERTSRRQTRNQTLSYSHDNEGGHSHGHHGHGIMFQTGEILCLCMKQCAVQPLINRGRTIIFIALFLICFLWIRDLRLIESMRYKIGIYSPAQLTISILESSSDENYPREDLSDERNYYSLKRKSEEGMFYEDRIIWKVEGVWEYIHNFTEGQDLYAKFGRFKNILFENEKLDLTNISGLWMMGYGQLEGKRMRKETSIKALMVTDHFKNNLGVAPEMIEVAVAMRAAIIGEARFQVRFQDGMSDKYHKEYISNEKFKEKGFCYYVFNLPFNRMVNSIYIKPVGPDPGKDANAVVLVDKVVIVVAKKKTTESFFHSIVPQDWC